MRVVFEPEVLVTGLTCDGCCKSLIRLLAEPRNSHGPFEALLSDWLLEETSYRARDADPEFFTTHELVNLSYGLLSACERVTDLQAGKCPIPVPSAYWEELASQHGAELLVRMGGGHRHTKTLHVLDPCLALSTLLVSITKAG